MMSKQEEIDQIGKRLHKEFSEYHLNEIQRVGCDDINLSFASFSIKKMAEMEYRLQKLELENIYGRTDRPLK